MKNRHFKVVKVRYQYCKDGKESLCSSSPCHGGELVYSLKQFTKMIPNTLGIFAFSDFESACRFARQMSKYRAYELPYEYRVYAVETRGVPVSIKNLLALSTIIMGMPGFRTRKARAAELDEQMRYRIANPMEAQIGPQVGRAPYACVSFPKVKLVRHCVGFKSGLEVS